jgi:hypothetical protein
MGVPRALEARLYYRAAQQRYEDAQVLLRQDRTTGGVYLAGYTVECLLKALVLEGVSAGLRRRLLEELRGRLAHNLEWLGGLYRRHVGTPIPRHVARHLARVAYWSTDLRYAGGLLRRAAADEFMGSVTAISAWADGRM